jgi:hypothetical protein
LSWRGLTVAIGNHIDGWRVCWIGGWDKCRVVFVVMVEKHPVAAGNLLSMDDQWGKLEPVVRAVRKVWSAGNPAN